MTPTQIVVLLALTIYAIYRQSIRHPVIGRTRFKLAIVYGAIGLIAGGFGWPADSSAWIALAISIGVSAVVGVVRGRLSRLWVESDGRVFSQGTPVTIGLFLLVVGMKWIVGTVQYLEHKPPGNGGFGEILVLIAVMIALQAEVIWRRTSLLGGAPTPVTAHDFAQPS